MTEDIDIQIQNIMNSDIKLEIKAKKLIRVLGLSDCTDEAPYGDILSAALYLYENGEGYEELKKFVNSI